VDGIITGELKTQFLTLTFPVSELNTKPIPVTGATILISNEDSVFNMTEQTVRFWSLQIGFPFPGPGGEELFIAHFLWQPDYLCKISKWHLPRSSISWFIQRMMISELYHVSWVGSSFSTEAPAMWEVLIDWSESTGIPADRLHEMQGKIVVLYAFNPGCKRDFCSGSREGFFPGRDFDQ